MACERITIRSLRLCFLSFLVFSLMMVMLLDLKHSFFWRYLHGITQGNTREINNKTVLLSLLESSPLRKPPKPNPAHKVFPNGYTDIKSKNSASQTTKKFDLLGDRDSEQSPPRVQSEGARQFPPVLFRPSDQIKANEPFWQTIDDDMDVLTYAAHYDDVETSAIIRIIGIARHPLPYSDVICRFYGCPRCPVMHSVSGTVAHFRNRNGRRYIGAFVLCPLSTMGNILPFATSVHKANHTSGTEPMVIHYSNTQDSVYSSQIQNLLKERSIVPKEGELEVFRSLWKRVRNGSKEGLEKVTKDADRNSRHDLEGDKPESRDKSERKKQEPDMNENETSTGNKEEENTEKDKNSSNDLERNALIDDNNQNANDVIDDVENVDDKTENNNDSERGFPSHNRQTISSSSSSISSNSNSTTSSSSNSSSNPVGYRWNITRCFPAFHQDYNEHVLLAEMVAASRALGVDHFVFYVESVSPTVNKTLQVLQSQGVAEVLPWNMHMVGKDVFYKAQFAAIQDCLYRQLHSSRYLLFGDVDELFVPKTSSSLVQLLDTWFKKEPGCGSFQFLNTFFNLKIPPPSQPSPSLTNNRPHTKTSTVIFNSNNSNKSNNNKSNHHDKSSSSTSIGSSNINNNNNSKNTNNGSKKNNPNKNNNSNSRDDDNNNQKNDNNNNSSNNSVDNNNNHHYNNTIYSLAQHHQLPIYLHTLRHTEILAPGVRSKVAADPRRVLVGSVHLVQKYRRGFKPCVMKTGEGLLHHYRRVGRSPQKTLQEDASIRQYGEIFVRDAVRVLEEVERGP